MLQCFEAAGETLTLAQLAQRTGLYKSTILRLAGSLIGNRFLQRDAEGRFSLGPELRRLGSLAQTSVGLEAVLRPELRRLTEATHETASFYVRQGRHRICLFRENSPRSVRHHLVEGGRHALMLGASGKLFRAYSRSNHDAADRATLQRGWAASRGERDPELAAVAVPVLNGKGHLLGVLNVSAVLSRFPRSKEEKARAALLESRKRIESRVFHVKLADVVQARPNGAAGDVTTGPRFQGD